MVELAEFRSCLGIAFYESLLEQVNCYKETEEWDLNGEYGLDDTVWWEGTVYRALGTVTVGEAPPHKDFWKLSPIFNSHTLNRLYCDHLGPYLTTAVIIDAAPELRTQLTAEGAVQFFSSNFNAANDKAFDQLFGSLISRKELQLSNMTYYIKKVLKTALTDECKELLEKYKPLAISCCGGCGEESNSCTCEDFCEDGRLEYLVG